MVALVHFDNPTITTRSAGRPYTYTNLAYEMIREGGLGEGKPESEITRLADKIAGELADLNTGSETNVNNSFANPILRVPDEYASSLASSERFTPVKTTTISTGNLEASFGYNDLRTLSDVDGLIMGADEQAFDKALMAANGLSTAQLNALKTTGVGFQQFGLSEIKLPEATYVGNAPRSITYAGLEDKMIGSFDRTRLAEDMQVDPEDRTVGVTITRETGNNTVTQRAEVSVEHARALQEKATRDAERGGLSTTTIEIAEDDKAKLARAEVEIARAEGTSRGFGVTSSAEAAEPSALQTTAADRDAAHERREDHYAELETRREAAAAEAVAANAPLNREQFAQEVDRIMGDSSIPNNLARSNQLVEALKRTDDSVNNFTAHQILAHAAETNFPRQNVNGIYVDRVIERSGLFQAEPLVAAAGVEAPESPETEAGAAVVAGPAAAAPAADASRKTLRRGDTGPEVEALQQQLISLGFDIDISGGGKGVYGPQTERAVRQAQTALGIGVDGVAGSQTFGAMETALAQNPVPDLEAKYKKMAASGVKPPATRPDRPVAADAPAPVEPEVDTAALAKTGANIVLGARTMTRDTYNTEQAELDSKVNLFGSKDLASYIGAKNRADAHREAGMPEIPADVKRALESGISVSFKDANGEQHTIDTSVASEQDRKTEMKELAAAIQAGPLEDVKVASAPDTKGQKVAKGPDLNGIY